MAASIFLIRRCSIYKNEPDEVQQFHGSPEQAVVEAQAWANRTCDPIAVCVQRRLITSSVQKPHEESSDV